MESRPIISIAPWCHNNRRVCRTITLTGGRRDGLLEHCSRLQGSCLAFDKYARFAEILPRNDVTWIKVALNLITKLSVEVLSEEG